MENSFYNLDYIISLGEKRVDLYLSAYQGVLGRLTNIILIYSAIGSFYYRALIYGLAAIVPYVICIGFHLSRKDDKVEKVHLVYQEKIVNCMRAT